MADKYIAYRPQLDSPIYEGFEIQANDSFNSAFSQPTRALWVGRTGNVRIRFVSTNSVVNGALAAANSNNTVNITEVPAGTILPFRIDMVFATGTTANGFVGLF